MYKNEKILLISCEGLGNGGVQNVIMNIVRNLSDLFTFDIVLFTNEKRFYDDEFLSYGGKIFYMPQKKTKFKIVNYIDRFIRARRIYKKTFKIIKENGPYIAIHNHNVLEGAMCLKAAEKSKINKRITHSHRDFSEKFKHRLLSHVIWNFYHKPLIKYTTCFIGCSQLSINTLLHDKNTLKNKPCKIIYNPYDDQKFNPDLYTINSKEFILIQVASFSDNKNQLFSLKVLNEIKKTYSGVKLFLVGFGKEYLNNKIYPSIEEMKLESNVEVYPSDADTPKLLSRSSGFLFPSKHEGFGIVLIEAQAMGVRCFVSDTVPKETDTGGCTFIPLSAGYKKWADIIINDYKKNKGSFIKCDCSEFKIKNTVDKFYQLYTE